MSDAGSLSKEVDEHRHADTAGHYHDGCGRNAASVIAGMLPMMVITVTRVVPAAFTRPQVSVWHSVPAFPKGVACPECWSNGD